MTARKNRRGKTVARQAAKPAPPMPEPPAERWPEVFRYALGSWSRTARACVIATVLVVLLLLAVHFGLPRLDVTSLLQLGG
jgi:hypothetical protein